jgi:two-component system sensor histidine kinase QseC
VKAPEQSSLLRRLMLGFALVILAVALLGLVNVVVDAKVNQESRTASENRARTREIALTAAQIADQPERIVMVARAIEQLRQEMFKELDYRSKVRVRIWRHGALLYNSAPELPDVLPAPSSERPDVVYGWVSCVDVNQAAGLRVERSHEVDDEWMFTWSGARFLLTPTLASLPFLLFPAWLIIRFGLAPLRAAADAIEQRALTDLTALPASKYRELSPLIDAINRLMDRLNQRIEREHEFLTDAAHELKTPLAVIQINAHLLQSRCASGESPARMLEAVDGLRDGVTRATHMVHQLLALERTGTDNGDQGAPVTALESLVGDRVAAAAPLALQRNMEIELCVQGTHPMPVHRESMAALLDNLIANAIKYSPDCGRITVAVDALEGGVRLSVSDQGPGIAPELRSKVFERFYRIPGGDHPGSGLGLAIAERAASRNGGVIRLDGRADGAGLVVTVDFTLAPRDEAPSWAAL